MPDKSNPVRHAVARSTGATTYAHKTDDGWRVLCLNHGAATTVASRGPAWKTASHPQDFCSTCGKIDAGKAGKITEGRLDAPTSPAKKQAPAKRAAKKASGK